MTPIQFNCVYTIPMKLNTKLYEDVIYDFNLLPGYDDYFADIGDRRQANLDLDVIYLEFSDV